MVHLQCRLLDDLTAVDEAKIKACGDVFDRLKSAKHSGKSGDANKKKKTVIEEKLFIRADADRLQMSHILALKKLFRDNPGKAQIELSFESAGRKIGQMDIAAPWGVSLDISCKDDLQRLSKEIPIAWLTE